MIQLRAGDLVGVTHGGTETVFAILTKQILFGGHWCFVCHPGAQPSVFVGRETPAAGFNAAVDFILAKREGRVERISRGNDFSSLMGPELLQQWPAKDETNHRIWRWQNGDRLDADFVRFTPAPTDEEISAPYHSCISADRACDLAGRRWKPHLGR